MKVQPRLLAWRLRELLPIMLSAATASIWVLVGKKPLFDFQKIWWPVLFILGHCFWIAADLGRVHRKSFAFLYSRGYSRDALWGHTILTSVVAAAAAWLPAAIVVWSGARAAVQDGLFENPYFPMMAPYEVWVPLYWLLGYALTLPVFHYVWIRRAQPVRGKTNGNWLVAVWLAAVFCWIEIP